MGLASDPAAQEWLATINKTAVPQEFEVLPENMDAVEVFMAMQTNWTLLAGMAGVIYQCLNYTALESVFRMMNIPRKKWRSLFDDIRILELSALPILNEKT